MVVVPSPWERVVRLVVLRARRSSSSSLRRSCSSPTSGATTSRIRRPSTRSSFGVKVAACSTSTRSASASVSAGVSVGRSSSARAITSACAVDTSPAECAPASTVQRWASDRASVRSRRAGPRSTRTVRWHHAATSRSPASSATSSATAISRNRVAATRDSRRASSTKRGGLLRRREVEELDGLGLVQSSSDRLATLLDQVSARHLSPPLTSRQTPPRAGSAARSQSTRTLVRTQGLRVDRSELEWPHGHDGLRRTSRPPACLRPL